MAVERTLILIKPDATERALAGEILARIERRGFTVVGGKLLRVSRDLGSEHYAEHSEKPFFGELVDFITSAPTWALVVEGEGAIATMRKTIGRDESRRRRRRARSAATSRPRCRTTSSTAPIRPSRRSARSRSGSPTMSSSEYPEYAPEPSSWTKRTPSTPSTSVRGAGARTRSLGHLRDPESELGVLRDVAGRT
jgi:nucleoside diphosphate kinase